MVPVIICSSICKGTYFLHFLFFLFAALIHFFKFCFTVVSKSSHRSVDLYSSVCSFMLPSSFSLSQGVDNSGDVYRATYTAFRCSSVSGTLGAHEKVQVGARVPPRLASFHWCAEPFVSVTGVPALILFMFRQVPITFLPRDRGDYAQFWDLECHPVSEPQQKSRVRFQLCGTVSAPLLPLQNLCWLHSFLRRNQNTLWKNKGNLGKPMVRLQLRSQRTKVLIMH